MKTTVVRLGGRDWEFDTNNSGWLSAGPKEAEELVKQLEPIGNGSKGNPIVQDETGKHFTISSVRLMKYGSQTETTKKPEIPEAFWDYVLGIKTLPAEFKEMAETRKNEWVEARKKEEESKKARIEKASNLLNGMSKEEILKALGLA